MSKQIAVYGSLREGEYNFNAFPDAKKVKQSRVEGFKLYSLGAYPGAIKSESEEDTMVVDIIEVGEASYERIRAMELGAGYTEESVDIEGEEYPIYVYRRQPREENLVESGDWSER